MGSNIIVSTGTVADGPGLCQGTHIFYAVNTGLWWAFTYKSASNTTLYARYSSDLVTWSDPTNNTKTLAKSNAGNGRCLGVAYANISSTDVVHINVFYDNTGGAGSLDINGHIRATLSGTTVTWGSEVQTTTNSNTNNTAISAPTAVASDGRVFDSLGVDGGSSGDFDVIRSTNADSGTSWTTGFPASGTLLFSSANTVSSSGLAPLSSGGKVIALGDNGAVTGTPTNVEYSLFGGSSWSPATATDVFATTVSIDVDDWGFCLRTDTDVHAVRRNDATSTFTHRRWNGTSWGAGDSIGNNTCQAGAGLAMVSDGTSVWLFIIDSDAANTVRYNKWTSGGGWGGWTAFEAATQTRKYVTAYYSSAKATIAVCWSATNGSNFDLTVESLSTGGAVDPFPAGYQLIGQILQNPVFRM